MMPLFKTIIIFNIRSYNTYNHTFIHLSSFTEVRRLEYPHRCFARQKEPPWSAEQRMQGVTKRCRLSWLTNSALVCEHKCGGGGVWVRRQWVQLCTLSPNKLWRSIFNLLENWSRACLTASRRPTNWPTPQTKWATLDPLNSAAVYWTYAAQYWTYAAPWLGYAEI